MEMVAIIISIISLFTSIWFVWINWKNSRKQKVYSEDIFSSCISVTSFQQYWGMFSIKESDEVLLKIYSLNQGAVRNYKIMMLHTYESINKGTEATLYNSEDQKDGLKNFSTKYHAIEYALFVHKLTCKIEKTPFGNEYWYK